MRYATIEDIEARSGMAITEDKIKICETLISDCAVMIDAVNECASAEIKCIVTCNMVLRALHNSADSNIPIGATQGTMSGLGYSQSWTISGGGSNGELYFSKSDKRLLGYGNKIGSSNPLGGM